MSATIAIYRIPTTRAAPIGEARVVMDRNQQLYIQGSRLVSIAESSTFLILTLADDKMLYVKADDYQRMHTSLRAKSINNRSKSPQRSKGKG